MDSPSWPNQTTSHLNPSPERTYQILLHGYNAWCYAYRDTTSQSVTAPVRKWSNQTHSLNSVPSQALTFQQAFVNDPEMWALTNLIITGWPEDIKEVPCPLCPYWQHRETLTVEDSLVLWGEALLIPPTERERVLHQLHQFHQGITKSQLLTHGSFF